MSGPNKHEILVGLHVTDEHTYGLYRAEMKPILRTFGGSFRRDFRVAEVLLGGEAAVNRVFILSFPSSAAKEGFFADEKYLAVRAKHFDSSVGHVDMIAEYETAGSVGSD